MQWLHEEGFKHSTLLLVVSTICILFAVYWQPCLRSLHKASKLSHLGTLKTIKCNTIIWKDLGKNKIHCKKVIQSWAPFYFN